MLEPETMETAFQTARRILRYQDDAKARMAFQAGARYALNVLAESLADEEATEKAAFGLNDEILAFAKDALARERAA